MKKAFIFIMAALAVAACKKDEDPYLTFSADSVELECEGGSEQIAVIANGAWTAVPDVDWITVSPTSGNGDGIITITVPDYAEPVSRSGNIVITRDVLVSNVAIVQHRVNRPVGGQTGTADFLIEEVFFAGCELEDGTSDGGDGDQYFKITNNTDVTLYADGMLLVISECDSQKTSTGAFYSYPEVADSIGVADIFQIPGSGKEVPVEAGASIVIAVAAQDFESGCDLSGADFEIYVQDKYGYDVDNPDVPDLSNWLQSSASLVALHNRGYESYAIVMPPVGMTSEELLADYAWVGKKVMDWNGYHYERDITGAYLIPNDWVLDAVNCAVDENFYRCAFNATVDKGYTNVATVDKDPERYGKSVVRKKDASGKLVDTNNSTDDFEISDPATLYDK